MKFTNFLPLPKMPKFKYQELKEDLASLKENFIQVGKILDRQEQYSRRNCLLVHEVDEKNNKDMDQIIINIVKNDLGEETTNHDFDRTHHKGKRKLNNIPQPIIV